MKKICYRMKGICYSMKIRDEKEENEPSLRHQLVGAC
jgi:hypothetical protein